MSEEKELTKEEIYNKYWKEIVENKDGSLNKKKIICELADYYNLMDGLPELYCHITNNGVSKLNTKKSEIIKAYEVYLNQQVNEIIEDELKELKEKNRNLQRDSDFLNALECAGVDNWEGYEEAKENL